MTERHPQPPRADDRDGDLRSRRSSLRYIAAGVGLAAVSGVLTACGGSRRLAAGTTLGEPIPDDPVLHRSRPSDTMPSRRITPPTPVATPPSTTVIAREHWAAGAPIVSRANPMGRISRITIHHDGILSPVSGSWSDSVRRLESIRRGHVGSGWADIGYHFAIDPAGRVWACRPIQLQGAHVRNQNPGNLGVMVIGNFEHSRPTPAASAAIASFVGSAMRQFGVPRHRVFTHRELAATACPGRYLQAYMDAARGGAGVLASI